MSNAHESFFQEEPYKYLGPNGTVNYSSTRTYKLSGYYVPNKHHDITKWKESVLNIANEYRQGYEYWKGPNSITVDVIFTDKNGLDLQSIKDDKSFEECINDIKLSASVKNVLENHFEIDEVLS